MKKKMQKNKMKQLQEGTRVDGAGCLQSSWEPERVEPPAAEEEDFSASDENFIEHITAKRKNMKQLQEGTRVDGAGLRSSWEPERVEPPAAEEEDFSASDENFIEHITAKRKKMKQLQEGTRVDGAGLQSSWEPERVEPPAAEEEDFSASDENFIEQITAKKKKMKQLQEGTHVDVAGLQPSWEPESVEPPAAEEEDFSAWEENFIEQITAKKKKMQLQEGTHVDVAGLQPSWEPERVEPPAAEEEEWTAWTREKLFQEVREKLPVFSPRAEEEDFSPSDEHFIEHITAKFEEFIMQYSVGADNSARIYEELEKINYTDLIEDFIAQESKKENAAEDFEEQAATSTMQPMAIEPPMEGLEIKEEAGTDKNHEQEEEGLDKKQEQEEEGLDKKQEQEEEVTDKKQQQEEAGTVKKQEQEEEAGTVTKQEQEEEAGTDKKQEQEEAGTDKKQEQEEAGAGKDENVAAKTQ